MVFALPAVDKIRLRASVNEWISNNFPNHRQYIKHSDPVYLMDREMWEVKLNANGCSTNIGSILVSNNAEVMPVHSLEEIASRLDRITSLDDEIHEYSREISGQHYQFVHGDGLAGAETLDNRKIDLLLTDPPYGISKSYICEGQVPRRLRNDGRDFIMPKGNFGEWDSIDPKLWLDVVLPKVGGWALSFCAQAQIGEYKNIFETHKFVAVGAMVWQKTNPVPFNHKYKPINAWEAIVVGKRPGTKFNGKVVHNVFRYKSPSPQQRIHPTQKPLALMECFVDLFTNEGDFVFDPFGGSATTLIASTNKKRVVLSYEMDHDIYQAACGRITEMIK